MSKENNNQKYAYYSSFHYDHPYSPVLKGEDHFKGQITENKQSSEIMLTGHPLLRYPITLVDMPALPYQSGTYYLEDEQVIYTQQTAHIDGTDIYFMLTRNQDSDGQPIDGFTVFYQDKFSPDLFTQDFHGHTGLPSSFTTDKNIPTVEVLAYITENISRAQLEENPDNSRILMGHLWTQFKIYDKKSSKYSHEQDNFINIKTAEAFLNLVHDDQTAQTAICALHQILCHSYSRMTGYFDPNDSVTETHQALYKIFKSLTNRVEENYSDTTTYMAKLAYSNYMENMGQYVPEVSSREWHSLEEVIE